MRTFQRPETIVLGDRVTNKATGALIEPATSMTVEVTDPNGVVIVAAGAMTHQDTPVLIDGISCNFTYDFNPAADAALGGYTVLYTAVDGTRTGVKRDRFVLE